VPWATIWATIGSILLTLIALQLLRHVERVLVWLVIAGFFAVLLNPAVDYLVLRVRMRRTVATLVVLLVGMLIAAGLLTLFIRPLVIEGQRFAEDLPEYVAEARAGRGPVGGLVERFNLDERLRNSSGQLEDYISNLGSESLTVVGAVGSAIVGLITVLVMTVLMLMEGPRLLRDATGALPADRRHRVRAVAADCARAVTGYMAGNLLISVVCGILTFVFLLIVGVPFAAVLALFTAVMDLIPLVGATVAAVVVTLVAFLHGPPAGIAAIIFFVVYQQFENHLLQPVVQSRTVKLSPLVVLVAVLIGVELAGILGALLGIPVAGVIQVIARDVWANRQGRLKSEPSIGVDEVPLSEIEGTAGPAATEV
jgi:predicted PurR-regulated permease PerM